MEARRRTVSGIADGVADVSGAQSRQDITSLEDRKVFLVIDNLD
jgi:hypothetical protein